LVIRLIHCAVLSLYCPPPVRQLIIYKVASIAYKARSINVYLVITRASFRTIIVLSELFVLLPVTSFVSPSLDLLQIREFLVQIRKILYDQPDSIRYNDSLSSFKKNWKMLLFSQALVPLHFSVNLCDSSSNACL